MPSSVLRVMSSVLAALLLCVLSAPSGAAPPARQDAIEPACGLRIVQVRCERRVDPAGVGERAPLFDWQLAAVDDARRGLVQSAYRLLVASSEEILAQDRGDLWDSGRVASSETLEIAYAGRPLRSSERAVFKLRVWDGQGAPSEWSRIGTFLTGLLDPADVHADFIGFDAPRTQAASGAPAFDDASWIWLAGEDALDAPTQPRLFRVRFTLPVDVDVANAELVVAVDDEHEAFLDGERVARVRDEVDAWRHPAVVDVTERLAGGEHVLAVRARNTAPGPAGLLARLVVFASDGSETVIVSDGSWRAAAEAEAEAVAEAVAVAEVAWTLPDFDDSSWAPVSVLGPHGISPWGRLRGAALVLPPPRYLRTELRIPREIALATLHATALGVYELELDGVKVGDEVLGPGWTDYARRVNVRTHDVTSLLGPGTHALGVILGDGWHSGYVGYAGERDLYGERTRAFVQLEIDYVDGTHEAFVSDGTWRASTGPLLASDLLMGETYDARLTLDDWSLPGFDDSGWAPVDVGVDVATDVEPTSQPLDREPGLELTAHPGPPIRVVEEVRARSIAQVGDDTWVLDLGQNLAGVVRLTLRDVPPGRRIVLRHAERVLDDGTLYTENLRGARATDTYVCRGGELEVWQPRFTFHGFQYVEVTGLGRPPDADTIVGLALSSDTPPAGRLRCSDPLVEQLFANTVRTQRSNFLDVPTDCPQRDERLGWTGDAQIYVATATAVSDAQAFYTKWLVDLRDSQRADGQFPMVAPLAVAGDDGGPAWADAGVIVPWALYEAYGDRRVLVRSYAGMRHFVEFCLARTVDLLPPPSFHCFGDWVALGADTPRTVIFEAYLVHALDLLARSAVVLGESDDARRYAGLAADVRAAFRSAYVDADGRVLGDTQCAYVLALAFDILEPAQAARASEHLVARIAERDWHLSTGFVGTKDLMLVLSEIGRDDVAYRLLQTTSYPSWGFSIVNGATSIWERWDGWTPERGFQDPGMNSFAHYAFGAVTQWMFERIGGIRAASPGYAEVLVAPVPGGNLTWAECEYDSIRGTIACSWRLLDEAQLEMDVVVPPNTSAQITVPTRSPRSILEGGRPVTEVSGLLNVETNGAGATFRAGSGHYRFRCNDPIMRRLSDDPR